MTEHLADVWPALLVLVVLFGGGLIVLNRAEEVGLAVIIAVDLALLAGVVALLLLVTGGG